MSSNAKVYKWSLIERISVAALNFGGNIVLARMLTTADFGLLAMIAIFIAIAQDISGCGLADGLIHKTKPTDDDYSTVFVFNTAFGLFFGLSFFIGAPLVAGFFGHEELIAIMRILGVCFFFQSMGFVQETRLRKELAMKKMCFVKVGSTLTAITLGIILAALGLGWWALVSTQIFLLLFTFCYCLIATRWFPRVKFSKQSFKELFGFGFHLAIAYISNVIGKNVNTFLLGKFFTPAASGLYYQGAKLANVPFQVSDQSVNNSFFVVASNESTPDSQRSLIRNMFSMVVGINSALLFLLLVIAGPAIIALYGSKWAASIPMFRILAVAEFLFCIKSFFQAVCKVHGSTVFVRNLCVIQVIVQILLLALTIAFFRDILVIVWVQVACEFFSVAVYAVKFRKLTQQPLSSICMAAFRSIGLPVLGAIFAVAAVAAVDALVTLPAIVNCVIIAVVYAVSVIGAGEVTRPMVYVALRNHFLKH
ncbi:MAG: oligosaccharide flippase family protein [[Clostridium] fimetarium]|nr:oligosaccharide flippase family protein [Alistipes timonensis]MCM1406801.1 oligosaccharide flippase family protein [[Clostridium] fimetarium]